MSALAASPRAVRRYRAFARLALARESAYRLDLLVALVGFAVRVYVLQFVWRALYRASGEAAPAGIELEAMLTYMLVGQLSALVLAVDAADRIREKVREGTIAFDLARPVSFPLYLLADAVGVALRNGVILLPALLLGLALVEPRGPASPTHALAFALSLALGFLVGFLLDFLTNLAAFWTLETFGLAYAQRFASLLLSGVVVPIWFFPPGLAEAARLLPFASIYGTPLSIFIGRVDGPALAGALALQAVWVAVLALAAATVWGRAKRRLLVQGG